MTNETFNQIEALTESIQDVCHEVLEHLQAVPHLRSRQDKERNFSAIRGALEYLEDISSSIYGVAEKCLAESDDGKATDYRELLKRLPDANKVSVDAACDLFSRIAEWKFAHGYEYSPLANKEDA